MNQVEFLRGDECFLGLQGQLAEIRPGKRRALDEFLQSLAADEFHHHVWTIHIGADVIDRDDVRVLQGGQCTGLLHELARGFFLKFRVARAPGNALDGDFAVHPRVIPPIHRAESTLADFSADFVSIFHAMSSCPGVGLAGAPGSADTASGCGAFQPVPAIHGGRKADDAGEAAVELRE